MEEKELRAIPKRKISEAEKQIIMLKIERVRLEREKSMMILNKAVMLFFAFLVVAVVGLINNIVTPTQLNILVMVGVSALIIGIIPYSISIRKEEKDIEATLKELTE
jgi:uncharacterized membrane protein YqjE